MTKEEMVKEVIDGMMRGDDPAQIKQTIIVKQTFSLLDMFIEDEDGASVCVPCAFPTNPKQGASFKGLLLVAIQESENNSPEDLKMIGECLQKCQEAINAIITNAHGTIASRDVHKF